MQDGSFLWEYNHSGGMNITPEENVDKVFDDGTLQRVSENISTTLVTLLNLKNMIKESENLIKAKS